MKGLPTWELAVTPNKPNPRFPLFSLSPHGVLYVFIIRNLTENVNMNHNEEVPDFLGGLGDMLPADVLKKVNELLEQRQGSPRQPRVHLCPRQPVCG